VVNIGRVSDHWNISELTLYSDTACGEAVSDESSEVLAVHEGDCDINTSEVLHDSVCTFGANCDPAHWANDPSHSGPGEICAGYALDTPASVRCISICQGRSTTQRITSITLQKSDDLGESWDDVGVLSTSTTEKSTATIFALE
jgi:hypothetical protein